MKRSNKKSSVRGGAFIDLDRSLASNKTLRGRNNVCAARPVFQLQNLHPKNAHPKNAHPKNVDIKFGKGPFEQVPGAPKLNSSAFGKIWLLLIPFLEACGGGGGGGSSGAGPVVSAPDPVDANAGNKGEEVEFAATETVNHTRFGVPQPTATPVENLEVDEDAPLDLTEGLFHSPDNRPSAVRILSISGATLHRKQPSQALSDKPQVSKAGKKSETGNDPSLSQASGDQTYQSQIGVPQEGGIQAGEVLWYRSEANQAQEVGSHTPVILPISIKNGKVSDYYVKPLPDSNDPIEIRYQVEGEPDVKSDLGILVIKVIPINDAPVFLDQHLKEFDMSETKSNNPDPEARETGFEASATDVDGTPKGVTPEGLIYLVVDERFEFEGSILRLKAGAVLDYEAEKTVTLEIAAFDGAAFSALFKVTLNVTNLLDEPLTVNDISDLSVVENSTTLTGDTQLSVTTEEALGFVAEYRLFEPNDNEYVEVSETGTISLKKAPDYDGPAGVKTIDVKVQARFKPNGQDDGDGWSKATTITINVTNLDDNAPVLQTVNVAATPEIPHGNETKKTVQLSATDADGDAVIFVLGGQNKSDNSLIESLSPGGELVFKPLAFNYDAASRTDDDRRYFEINVRVRSQNVTSEEPNKTSEKIKIYISNLLDEPLAVKDAPNLEVEENSEVGTVLVTLAAVTSENLGAYDSASLPLKYRLHGQNEYVEVSNNGVVRLKKAPDYDGPADVKPISFGVQVRYKLKEDPANVKWSEVKTIEVNVTNLLDEPLTVNDISDLSVVENSTTLTGDTQLSVTTKESLGTDTVITYSLVEPNEYVEVSSNGVVSLKKGVDYEALSESKSISFDVVATMTRGDVTIISEQKTITINVTNAAYEIVSLTQQSQATKLDEVESVEFEMRDPDDNGRPIFDGEIGHNVLLRGGVDNNQMLLLGSSNTLRAAETSTVAWGRYGKAVLGNEDGKTVLDYSLPLHWHSALMTDPKGPPTSTTLYDRIDILAKSSSGKVRIQPIYVTIEVGEIAEGEKTPDYDVAMSLNKPAGYDASLRYNLSLDYRLNGEPIAERHLRDPNELAPASILADIKIVDFQGDDVSLATEKAYGTLKLIRGGNMFDIVNGNQLRLKAGIEIDFETAAENSYVTRIPGINGENDTPVRVYVATIESSDPAVGTVHYELRVQDRKYQPLLDFSDGKLTITSIDGNAVNLEVEMTTIYGKLEMILARQRFGAPLDERENLGWQTTYQITGTQSAEFEQFRALPFGEKVTVLVDIAAFHADQEASKQKKSIEVSFMGENDAPIAKGKTVTLPAIANVTWSMKTFFDITEYDIVSGNLVTVPKNAKPKHADIGTFKFTKDPNSATILKTNTATDTTTDTVTGTPQPWKSIKLFEFKGSNLFKINGSEPKGEIEVQWNDFKNLKFEWTPEFRQALEAQALTLEQELKTKAQEAGVSVKALKEARSVTALEEAVDVYLKGLGYSESPEFQYKVIDQHKVESEVASVIISPRSINAAKKLGKLKNEGLNEDAGEKTGMMEVFKKFYTKPVGADADEFISELEPTHIRILGIHNKSILGIPNSILNKISPFDIGFPHGSSKFLNPFVGQDVGTVQDGKFVSTVTWDFDAYAMAKKAEAANNDGQAKNDFYKGEAGQLMFHLSVDNGYSWSRQMVYGGGKSDAVDFFDEDVGSIGRSQWDPGVNHIWGFKESNLTWFNGERKLSFGPNTNSGEKKVVSFKMMDIGGASDKLDTLLFQGVESQRDYYAVVYDYRITDDDVVGVTLAEVM